MSEQKKDPSKDSFGLDNKKSPWTVYALLQIPIVMIMVIILYVMYQAKKS